MQPFGSALLSQLAGRCVAVEDSDCVIVSGCGVDVAAVRGDRDRGRAPERFAGRAPAVAALVMQPVGTGLLGQGSCRGIAVEGGYAVAGGYIGAGAVGGDGDRERVQQPQTVSAGGHPGDRVVIGDATGGAELLGQLARGGVAVEDGDGGVRGDVDALAVGGNGNRARAFKPRAGRAARVTCVDDAASLGLPSGSACPWRGRGRRPRWRLRYGRRRRRWCRRGRL